MRGYLPLALVALFISACAGGDDPAGNATPETSRVQVEEFEYQQLPGGARIITGSVYNASEEPIAHAQIQVSLYDESNTRVESMIIPLRDIRPGEHEAFREAVRSKQDIRAAKPRSVIVR